MGTTSRGRKPDEWAAKVNHTHIINDSFVKEYLKNCSYPKSISEEDKDKISEQVYEVENISNPIEHILAVDGGYTTVEVNKNFPSSELAFFQFGALLFDKKDLTNLSKKPFIFPEDMQKLQKLNRFKLVLPIKNINYGNESSLTNAFRRTIYDFFMNFDGICLMQTLDWLVFERYKPINNGSNKPEDCRLDYYVLGTNPNNKGKKGNIQLNTSQMSENYMFINEGENIYLTDIFRFHEVIDDDLGAAGVLGYVTRLIEQIIIVHFIKQIYCLKPSLLEKFLFIADGPLSFSGQTANMHKSVRNLCNFLHEKQNLYLAGIEKSGAFVDHAYKISVKKVPESADLENTSKKIEESRESLVKKSSVGYLKNSHYLIPSNKYIYTYITIGDSETMTYGVTSYYSGKVIFHSRDGQVIVVSVPTQDKDVILNPKKTDYRNIDIILQNIALLKCDMYDNSIVPIALANKLVSLANHPSQILLDKFASNELR